MTNSYIATVPDFCLGTLFSGSKGNGIFVRCGADAVLIDAGFSAKAVRENLGKFGADCADLRGIFITHEHSDHTRAIPLLSRTLPVHIPEGCAPYIPCDEAHRVVHAPLYTVTVGDMEISSFVTPHDSHCSVGYRIRTPLHTVGIATDLGHMPDSILALLAECDSVVLESNHDEKMLQAGPYPAALKERILSDRGHLSNRVCAESAVRLAKCGVRSILLAHLSEENNTPALAFRQTDTALAQAGCGNVRVAVADRRLPTRLL